MKVAKRDQNRVLDVLDLQYGDPVLAYRERSHKGEGPYKFIGHNRKTVVVESVRGDKFEFPTVAVKRKHESSTLFLTVNEIK